MKLWVILLLGVVFASGCLNNTIEVENNIETSDGLTIEMTENGYFPTTLEINVGDTVTWVNTGTRANWPASVNHPTHKNYPGSDINKCDSGEEIFDACEGIQPGEYYSFTFNEIGTWSYHDHIKAGNKGTIVVS